MARKLKKYQGRKKSEVKANPYGVAEYTKNRDAANNDLIAYFNSLERRDPGMMGDVVPVQPKVVKEPTGNTTILKEPLWPAPVRFKKGGSWEGLGKSDKPKKIKYKKNKKSKPNKKGLFKI
jgi:hypothetical protein